MSSSVTRQQKRKQQIVNNSERNRLYQEHRTRVQNAKPCVNSHAPRRKVSLDGVPCELSYIEMMAEMNGKAKTARAVRTFSKAPEVPPKECNRSSSNTCYHPWQQNNWGYYYGGYGNGYNWDYGYPGNGYPYPPPKPIRTRSSLTTKSAGTGAANCGGGDGDYRPVVNKVPSHQQQRKATDIMPPNRPDANWDIPEHVMHRYEHLTTNHQMLRRLLRPRIFFDLEVKGLRPLGRLIVQLYTEACPEVVLEFVRVCTEEKRERIAFTRFFPPMWCEGKIELTDHRTLTMPAIEHDENVLDHGSGPGILSFPSRYVRGSKCRFLTFSLSFKPLQVLNGRRIAFGRVRRGLRLLDMLQDFGQRNNGKPYREIMLTKCGMLK